MLPHWADPPPDPLSRCRGLVLLPKAPGSRCSRSAAPPAPLQPCLSLNQGSRDTTPSRSLPPRHHPRPPGLPPALPSFSESPGLSVRPSPSPWGYSPQTPGPGPLFLRLFPLRARPGLSATSGFIPERSGLADTARGFSPNKATPGPADPPRIPARAGPHPRAPAETQPRLVPRHPRARPTAPGPGLPLPPPPGLTSPATAARRAGSEAPAQGNDVTGYGDTPLAQAAALPVRR